MKEIGPVIHKAMKKCFPNKMGVMINAARVDTTAIINCIPESSNILPPPFC